MSFVFKTYRNDITNHTMTLEFEKNNRILLYIVSFYQNYIFNILFLNKHLKKVLSNLYVHFQQKPYYS
ncbi:Uncharacterised protein [Enterobacter ludwigii]|uniref:Uncharacterized protein n=1 Tax=Enterobacter cloacae TaxID=550 RepID=A0A0H3ZLT2_ENTCL|nr:hypothetical protein [Enterobacter cloacae]AKN35442.1 hypothetical protein [Enterobacter cloacae]AKN35476.1 hypothetical protein [Enterobacter cloacae]AQV12088.1 hypothetical protein [Enterobacter cloacae]SAB10286.1 Uncharacterised protein [Enterobacter ludwigii]